MVFPLIAAAVAGVAGIAGSAISASATKKAANAARDAAAANNAEAKAARDQISGYVSPYMPGAYAANSELSRLLGGSSGNALGTNNTQATFQAQNDGNPYDEYEAANPDLAAESRRVVGSDPRFSSAADYYAWHDANFANEGRSSFVDQGPAAQAATGAAPAAANPAESGYFGPSFAERPDYTRPDYGSAPATPNIDPSKYTASPYFDWLLNQGNRNLKAGSAAGGLGQSGSAVKEALSYGQGLAGQDYQKWVNNQLSLDSIARNQYNADRSFANQNYDVDTQRDIAIYDADRNYDTSRFDTRVGNLFQLSNQGLGAAGMLSNNANNYAGNVASNNNAAASATGNAAISNANSVNNLLGQGLQGLGYLYGASKGTLPKTYGI